MVNTILFALHMLVWALLGILLVNTGITIIMWQFWAIVALFSLGQILMAIKTINDMLTLRTRY